MAKLLASEDAVTSLAGSSQTLKADYARLSPGKNVVIVEGLTLDLSKGLPEAIDARVLVVHDYALPLSTALPEYKKLGKRLLGIVLNKVPQNKLEAARSQAAKDLGPAGIKLLGAIAEDRLLAALSVAELAEVVQGKILNNPENSGELVENFMLGALAYDSGIDYFNRKNNKAVVLKGDRPDMQLAALQTSVKCLIISGGVAPIPMVAIQARDKKVPLILAAGDNLSLVAGIENAVSRAKFAEPQKLPRLLEIMNGSLDMKALSAL
jgi:BioD-like phosphotransacetylase family protein